MKRFGLFLLVTMAAAIFTSCNDSDGDYPRLSAFASVKPLENNDFYVVLDDGKTVYPGDKSRIGSYKAEEDQRVVIYFNLLNNKVEGYDYNMALYYIQDIYSGGTKVVTTQEELDALEDDKTSFMLRTTMTTTTSTAMRRDTTMRLSLQAKRRRAHMPTR